MYQDIFDQFIFDTERDLHEDTARRIAKELGVDFEADNYDYLD